MRDVVLRRVTVHLPVDIHAALVLRQRIVLLEDMVIGKVNLSCWLPFAYYLCHLTDGGLREDIPYGKAEPCLLVDGDAKTHGGYRGQSDGDKVGCNTEPVSTKLFGCKVEELLFQWSGRWNCILLSHIGSRQSLTIYLAVRSKRQLFQTDVGGRHHVVRQRLCKELL